MPVLQQQSSIESAPTNSPATSPNSNSGSGMKTISELLGLNMPRGTTLGHAANANNLWTPTTTRPQRVRPPCFASFENMENNGYYSSDFQPQTNSMPPTSSGYSETQPFSMMSPLRVPRAIRGMGSAGTPPYSDCSSPSMDSDGSHGSVTSADLTEMMNNLSISAQGGICSPPTEQELANLRALHTLTNNLAVPPWLYNLPTPQLDNRQNPFDSIDVLELVARFHRNQAASFFDATLTWRGVLPPRFLSDNPTFSCKVFLGGVPWDVSEETLISVFSQFGNVQVEWPGKEQAPNQPKGYVYIIFESEKQVKALINSCKRDVSHGNCENWYFRVSSRKLKSKEVQVIPWSLVDSNYMESPNQKLDPHCTVFVGALHGMLNAEGLYNIMNDLFGGVIYAGIDTDKFRYPIGSARVCFNNHQSYINAVSAAFIEIKTVKFVKKVQVDPYLEDSPCSGCWVRQGPYFCRELSCFRYFCHSCWMLQHQFDFGISHKPLTRSTKTHTNMPVKGHFVHQ